MQLVSQRALRDKLHESVPNETAAKNVAIPVADTVAEFYFQQRLQQIL